MFPLTVGPAVGAVNTFKLKGESFCIIRTWALAEKGNNMFTHGYPTCDRESSHNLSME
jgi:hypothetical protein